jgi:hypothetical protein
LCIFFTNRNVADLLQKLDNGAIDLGWSSQALLLLLLLLLIAAAPSSNSWSGHTQAPASKHQPA